jgi:hypothetical protein
MQNQSTGQKPLLMEPPQVIMVKDLLYLKDHLSWQLMAMKKCAHFAIECEDPEIKQALDQTGKMHYKHYQLLLKHLQVNNQQQMTQLQPIMQQVQQMEQAQSQQQNQ